MVTLRALDCCYASNASFLRCMFICPDTVLAFDDDHQADEEDSSLTLDHGRMHKLPPGILPHGFPQAVDVQPAITAAEQAAKKEEEEKVIKPKDLSDEEKQMIIMSSPFQRFFDKTARIMERALCEQHMDIFVDYSKSADSDDAGLEIEYDAYKISLRVRRLKIYVLVLYF
jgi:hypothetical protein